MEGQSLREDFHDLVNKIQGIAVNSRSFAYLCGNYPEKIDSSTKDKLSKALYDITECYNSTVNKLNSISAVIMNSAASGEWPEAKKAIDDELKEIFTLLGGIRGLYGKISGTDYRNDILNISGEMNLFQDRCESIARITDDFKEKLIFIGIYDKNSSGR